MSEQRDKMITTLKTIVIPSLRTKGFSGSFPHFRRIRAEQIDLLTFQFSMFGPQFCVNLHACPPAGYTNHSGKHTPPNKVTVTHIGGTLPLRLGSTPPKQADNWFSCEGTDDQVYTDAALEVLSLINTQAEEFWLEREHAKPTDA
jgi:hypothetical protein